MTVLQPIATFDESIEAAKIVSRAIAEALLDDAGETADITPLSFEVDERGTIVAVVARILSSAKMAEGLFASGRFKRYVTSSDTQSARRAPRTRQGLEMLETTARIPTELVA